MTFDSELAENRANLEADGTPGAFEQLVGGERLQRVLEQIPLKYRQVLLMNKCDGLTNPEIAQRLGVTPETVVRYLARAVAFARQAQWD